MKIVIPVNEKDIELNICEFFGRTKFFLIYNSETKEYEFVFNVAKDSQGGAGIKAAQQLIDLDVDVIIATQLGNNVVDMFKNSNIDVYKGVKDSIKVNVLKFLNNELEKYNIM